MSNYKIQVESEAESHQAQEYFEQLGYKLLGFDHYEYPKLLVTYDDKTFTDIIIGEEDEELFHLRKELDLQQLKDMVVLHRNNPCDANYEDGSNIFYKTSGDIYSVYHFFDGVWIQANPKVVESPTFKPIQKPQVQTDADLIAEVAVNNVLTQKSDLISGADVPRHLKNFGKVQFRTPPNGSFAGGEWTDIDLEKDEEEFTLGDFLNSRYEWRLKPLIINGIEVPAPFFHHPEKGQVYLYLDDSEPEGFTGERYCGNHELVFNYGWWDSEEKIKQVVDALRKLFKGAI